MNGHNLNEYLPSITGRNGTSHNQHTIFHSAQGVIPSLWECSTAIAAAREIFLSGAHFNGGNAAAEVDIDYKRIRAQRCGTCNLVAPFRDHVAHSSTNEFLISRVYEEKGRSIYFIEYQMKARGEHECTHSLESWMALHASRWPQNFQACTWQDFSMNLNWHNMGINSPSGTKFEIFLTSTSRTLTSRSTNVSIELRLTNLFVVTVLAEVIRSKFGPIHQRAPGVQRIPERHPASPQWTPP